MTDHDDFVECRWCEDRAGYIVPSKGHDVALCDKHHLKWANDGGDRSTVTLLPWRLEKRAARFALARSEAERIAKERGVPCYPGTDFGRKRALWAQCGPPCGIKNACGPFGVGPSAYYDEDKLVAITYPVDVLGAP